jgi:hypothetical protein
LTAQRVEEIVEIKATILKEVEITNVASQNFIAAWRSKKHARVARDKPQVSVGGLLDNKFWDIILVKILSIEEVCNKGALEKKED